MDTLTPCSIRAREVYARRCFSYRKKVIKLFLYGILLAVFVWQIIFLLSVYLERRTFWTAEEIADPPTRLPPFVICPWPSFNPFRLMNLGLNSSVATGRELFFNYENLVGIDDGLPGRRLVEEAAWRLEEIVEEAMVGDVHEVYNTTNASSLLWQRTFNPIGPCLTLTPPPLSCLSSKGVMVKLRKSDLERCKWKENGFTRFYRGPKDCSAIQKYCNTSCAWEQFIKNEYYRMNFLYLGSTSNDLNIHYANTDMRMLSDKNFQVKVEPYHIIHFRDTDIPSRRCFHECIVKAAERKKRCKGLLRSRTQEPIQDLCITQSQQYSVSEDFVVEGFMYRECKESCKPDKREIQWVLTDIPSPQSGVFVVNLSSSSYTALTEKEVYPFSQFMSDVGGSLGLFLGISLLSVLEVIVIAGKSIQGTKPDAHLESTYLQLLTLSGEVAISLVACTHLSLVFFEYKYQALNTEVTLQENIEDITAVSRYGIIENSTEDGHPLKDLVIAYIASRSLGCQVIPQNSELGCFVRCILQGSKTLPPPLISTDDLPLCTQGHLSLPKKKYILSHQIRKYFVQEDQVKLCTTKCWKSENGVQKNQSSINVSIEQNFKISKSALICAVGGIIGLYYGVSLLHILPRSDSVCIPRLINTSTYNVAKLTIQISIAFVGALLSMFQVQSFLFDHPVTTSYSSRRLEGEDLPAFTVCAWPPFSMKRMLEEAGFEGAYEQALSGTSADKRASIISLLRNLSETQYNGRLDQLWRLGAWNIHEVKIYERNAIQRQQCLECSKNVGGIFHSCHTYIPDYRGDIQGAYFSVTVFIPKEAKVILSIHSPDDLPVMESDVVLHNRAIISLDQFSHWSGLQGDSRGWGKCVSECLEGALRRKMGCVLPWSASRGCGPACNVDEYTELLWDLWSLGSRPQHTYSALLGARVTNACRQKCHQKSGVFYSSKFNGEIHIGPSFTMQLIPSNNSQSVSAKIEISTTTFESVTEHDGYPVSKLLCEIGGVAGMTVGLSLASLINVIWKALERH